MDNLINNMYADYRAKKDNAFCWSTCKMQAEFTALSMGNGTVLYKDDVPYAEVINGEIVKVERDTEGV